MTFLLRRAARIARLVDEVREVGAGEARRLARDVLDRDGLVERLALGVDLEDRDAALHVRAVEDDLAVEAARAQQRRVEDVRPVGGGDDDHVGVRVEAVHLDEDLVERLLALVVASRRGRRRAGGRPRRSRPRTRCTGVLRLAWSNRSRTRLAPTPTNISTNSEPEMLKNGTPASPATARASSVLPVPGGPDEQHAARDARAERVELLGVLEELDDFLELRLGLVDAGDVGERDDRLVAEEHPRAALAEAHRLVVGALGLAHHEEDEAADEEQRQQARQQEADPRVVGRRLPRVDLSRQRSGCRRSRRRSCRRARCR